MYIYVWHLALERGVVPGAVLAVQRCVWPGSRVSPARDQMFERVPRNDSTREPLVWVSHKQLHALVPQGVTLLPPCCGALFM